MEIMRQPFQGVWNIVRFNWHFYLFAGATIGCVIAIFSYLDFTAIGIVISTLILAGTLISLLVSFYVYDISGIYRLKWMENLIIPANGTLVNFSAGFDETSALIQHKFPASRLSAFDFYDPTKNTEVSIRRARKAYPSFPGTKKIEASSIQMEDNSADAAFVIFAAHEIRKEVQRDMFFLELKRIIKSEGKIVVTEHLRDIPNFVAYTIGFFHFMPLSSWRRTFKKCELRVVEEFKITPFVSTFILQKNAVAS